MVARLVSAVKGNSLTQLALAGVGVVVGIGIVKTAKKAVDKAKTQAVDNKIQNSNQLSDGQMKAFDSVVTTIYDEIHGSWFFDSEDKIIEYLNSLKTVSQVRIACTMYQERYNKSLKADCMNAFGDGLSAIVRGWAQKNNLGYVNQVVQANWF